MKFLNSTLLCMTLMATTAFAEEVKEEETGFYINGELEVYLDDEWPEGDIDTRGEVFAGFQKKLNDHGPVDWVGAGARYDTTYMLDRTKDNSVLEKQLGFGIKGTNTRVYIGETDAQRLGFAKTSKIGAPVIVIEPNSRIDHKEKVVVTFGNWQNNNEFKFNEYRMKRDGLPFGGVVGYEPETETTYAGATVRAFILDLSYMQIDTNGKDKQVGYSAGLSLFPFRIPVSIGYEQFDDGGNVRKDYGIMYIHSKEVMLTAHRVEEDDVGLTFNYYGALYTPDPKGPMRYGLYYHQNKAMEGPYGNRKFDNSFKATIEYLF
jgi:hypothetical protein